MAEHNILGKRGEIAAARYLVTHGYNIVAQDWHHGHRDIDIIATKLGVMVFVEVKTRSSEEYGTPEESVDDEKIRNILEAAHAYVCMNKIEMALRFDIIAVVSDGNSFRIKHYPDAFNAHHWTPNYFKEERW